MAICEVQQATQEAKEALMQGLEALNQSLSDTIASDALSSPTNMLTTWSIPVIIPDQNTAASIVEELPA
ncbi:hypothetical protein Ccrd_013272 [Cynara cardunculus var. scolymus]|uniref:Uncharacterized protein n=1 Tax=Cynara cardunculus var. scolymus TaxID=59895 RepID=A0A103YFX5_CYNCS|nr:hypothetical protein Ccrd_013272 [Cynara cardunculus var. scolymus]